MTTAELRRPTVPLERLNTEAMLACVEPFSALAPADLDLIAAGTTRSRRPGGSVIVREGAVPEGVFVVLRGRVNLVRSAPGGRDVILATLMPGDIFGETAALDGSAATTTALASMPTDVARLPADVVAEVLRREPAALIRLVRLLSQRLCEVESMASALALCDVEQRLRRTLVRLARRQGRSAESQSWMIAPVPTQSELARMVGSCRETVSRTISAMARNGQVSSCGRRLVLSDALVDDVTHTYATGM